MLSHKDLLKLVNKTPVAEASDNVILTERSGVYSGIIAVELQNKDGYIVLDGQYTELISSRQLSGRVKVKPYEVLVLKKRL